MIIIPEGTDENSDTAGELAVYGDAFEGIAQSGDASSACRKVPMKIAILPANSPFTAMPSKASLNLVM
jgi:hypothetical protein